MMRSYQGKPATPTSEQDPTATQKPLKNGEVRFGQAEPRIYENGLTAKIYSKLDASEKINNPDITVNPAPPVNTIQWADGPRNNPNQMLPNSAKDLAGEEVKYGSTGVSTITGNALHAVSEADVREAHTTRAGLKNEHSAGASAQTTTTKYTEGVGGPDLSQQQIAPPSRVSTGMVSSPGYNNI